MTLDMTNYAFDTAGIASTRRIIVITSVASTPVIAPLVAFKYKFLQVSIKTIESP